MPKYFRGVEQPDPADNILLLRDLLLETIENGPWADPGEAMAALNAALATFVLRWATTVGLTPPEAAERLAADFVSNVRHGGGALVIRKRKKAAHEQGGSGTAGAS